MDYQPEKQDGAYIICKKDIRTSVGDMEISNQEGGVGMDETNEIYEKVVSIIEEGVKPLEQLYAGRGAKFTVEDVGMIADTFFCLYNKMIDYYKELK